MQFLLSANPGMPLLPLSKVASGGELARTMLALRLVMIGHEGDTAGAASTLIFDEVDAGIGGAAATAVGEALAAVAERTRCSSSPTSPRSPPSPTRRSPSPRPSSTGRRLPRRTVDGDRRVAEVARMLSGDAGGAAAEQHAAELLAR